MEHLALRLGYLVYEPKAQESNTAIRFGKSNNVHPIAGVHLSVSPLPDPINPYSISIHHQRNISLFLFMHRMGRKEKKKKKQRQKPKRKIIRENRSHLVNSHADSLGCEFYVCLLWLIFWRVKTVHFEGVSFFT